MDSGMHSGQCVPPLLLSHELFTCMIGQYYLDYKQKAERFQYQYLVLLPTDFTFISKYLYLFIEIRSF